MKTSQRTGSAKTTSGTACMLHAPWLRLSQMRRLMAFWQASRMPWKQDLFHLLSLRQLKQTTQSTPCNLSLTLSALVACLLAYLWCTIAATLSHLVEHFWCQQAAPFTACSSIFSYHIAPGTYRGMCCCEYHLAPCASISHSPAHKLGPTKLSMQS